MEFSWLDEGILGLLLAALVALLGNNLLGRLAAHAKRTRPLLDISIIPRDEGWTAEAFVHVPAGKPPVVLYTLIGHVTSPSRTARFLRPPVLWEQGPGPRLVAVERFTYDMRDPLPPKGETYRLTVYLVAEGWSIKQVYDIFPDGGWLLRTNWFRHQVQQWRLRRWFQRTGQV